jgi:branched-chain amino acid transport system ATP-binding protein
MTAPADVLLSANNLDVHYGPIQAVRNVSLQVCAGMIVTVLGANGAGKTTLLRAISGAIDPEVGEVVFAGRSTIGMTADQVMRLGISHVPEGREIFPLLTVKENLMIGAYTRTDRDGITHDMEMCFEYFPILRERAAQRAGLLSGGQQQMLAIARALMGRPRLLLMDEPSLGLSPLLVTQIFEVIGRINRERGVGVLLVEQNSHLALRVADYGYVLELGRVVMQDSCENLMRSDEIRGFYLGYNGAGASRVRRPKRKQRWN